MPDEPEPLLDTSILAEICHSTGMAGFGDLIDEFVGEVRRLANDLGVPEPTTDSDELGRIAHELTGMAMTFGALRLGETARRIMIDCHNDTPNSVSERVTILMNTIDDTLAAVDTWRTPSAV